jgi:hypothetical protein
MLACGTVFDPNPTVDMGSDDVVPTIGLMGNTDPGIRWKEGNYIPEGIIVDLGTGWLSISMEFHSFHHRVFLPGYH